MPFELVPKEKMLKPAESWYANIIIYIENIGKMRLSEEDKILLLIEYDKGVKEGINQLFDATDRVDEKKPLSTYALGIRESIQKITDFIIDMEKDYLREDIGIEIIHILLIKIFMKGINDVADLYRRNKLNSDIIIIIEDIDKIISDYLEDLQYPEEVWEKIRNRIGFSTYLNK